MYDNYERRYERQDEREARVRLSHREMRKLQHREGR